MKKITHDQKRFEKWAIPILLRLQKTLLLQALSPINLEFSATLDENTTAECACHYPYKTITITYGRALLAIFVRGDLKSATNTLVHEMCHPLTDPLYVKGHLRYISKTEINDEREALTDHIANILLVNGLV